MTDDRRQVILLCFACEPGAGSEEGVGWTWAVAAAQVADVTLITSTRAAPNVRAAVAEQGLPIEVVALDLPAPLRRLFPKKLIFVYYLVWQGLAARQVRHIERARRIDAVHHLTWASDSLPSALLASRAPVRVWGPVGGSTTTARGLYRYLTPRGKFEQAFRDVVNGVIRTVSGRRVARHATLIAAQNHDVADQFASSGTPVELEGNLAFTAAELAALTGDGAAPAGPSILATERHPADPDGGPRRTALFAGRLIAWKGLLLAVRALAEAPDWRLVVVGEGPERLRAEALASTLGVSDRIEYRGKVARPQVLEALRRADALLMPSFHDSASWSVGEAAAVGCPVVCLDAGGPKLMAGSNGHVVTIGDGSRLPQRMAAALDGIDGRGPLDTRWTADRLPALLTRWYGIAAEPARSASVAEEATP